MTAVVVLLILAVLFGIGAVIEGLSWMLLIGFALLIAAVWLGWSEMGRPTQT